MKDQKCTPKMTRWGINLSFLAVAMCATTPAVAVDWDDAGGSASKLWSDFGNWNPDGSPSGQAVNIGNLAGAANDTTIFDGGYQISSLTITNGADVVNSTDNGATDDFELVVNGDTTVSGSGSSIIIYGGDPDGLDTNNLTINSGASVIINSTTAQGTAVIEVDGGSGTGLLDINSGGTLIGTGRIDLEAAPVSATNLISNDGTITANTTPLIFGFAPAAGTLQITALSTNARFDWDGSSGNGVLNVNGNQTLDVDVDTGTDAFSGTMNLSTGSSLDMANGWSMDTGTINANTPAFGLIIIGQDPNPGPAAVIKGSNWTMTGGTINVDDAWDTLQLDTQLVASGGTINNNGTMVFNGGATLQSGVDFNMNSNDSSLVVNSTVNIDTPDFNLDGNEAAGNVTTINAGGNLDIDAGAGADLSFGHTINMNGGELDVTSTTATNWALNSLGSLNVAGNATSTINSSGLPFQISGNVKVADTSLLNVNSTAEFYSAVDVVIDAGSTLNMATATYNGGNYTGSGIFRPGVSTIATSTTWGVSIVDFDDGNTTVSNGATLTINADSIEDAGDGIDGTTTIEDTGLIQFNLTGGADVIFDADLTYNGDTISSNFILQSTTGSAIHFQGNVADLNINGDGGSLERLIFSGGSRLNINDVAEDFRLGGGSLTAGSTNEIDGSTINGPGTLQASTGRALRGNGTINAPIDFDGTAQLIATGGTLIVNGALVDVGTLGTSGGSAVLNVTNTWNTNVTTTVLLQGGSIIGSTITNDGADGINGNGTVSARIINNSVVDAEGGNLTINNTTNDWDGSTNTGLLRAITGDLQLIDNAAFIFQGTVEVNNGRQVFANGFELEFDPGSRLLLHGGTYRSTNATDIGGIVTVDTAASTIQNGGTTIFESTSSTTLNANLLLNNPTTRVQSGASFSGGSTLINAQNRALVIEDGADIDVLIQNRGTLESGLVLGQSSGLDFEQTVAGTWNVDLNGTGLNDYDRMTLTGIASLAGTLDIAAIGGFAPSLGDSFTILLASNIIGTFDSVLGSPGAGLEYDVIYNATNVTIEVVNAVLLPGDLNNDGFVGLDDLDIVLANWNQSVPPADPAADPSGDNFVGLDDLDIVLNNWNAGTPPTSSAAVPEPGAALLLASMGIGMVARRGRKTKNN